MSDRQPKRIVKLLDPKMCVGCRFHALMVLEDRAGRRVTVNHCKRLDCDNHDITIANLEPDDENNHEQ